MKVGDKIVCTQKLYNWLSVGKYYTIMTYDDYYHIFEIIDDEGEYNSFDEYKNFQKYFINIKDARKEKIQKINESAI